MGNKGTSSAVIDQPTEDELAKMKPAGKKGWQFRVEAAKKLASRSPMGRESRLEAAAELAEKAATQFKLSKMYDEAGECYQLQADAYMRMKETMQTASALIQAAETYGKHGSAEQAFEVYTSAIEIYKDAGKFDRAGKNQLALANILKKDGQSTRAAEAFRDAGDLYEMSGKGESSVRKCKEELALLLADEDDSLEEAANLFCEIGETCMEKNITKFHAKGFFQKCVFCHLAMGDTVGASEAAETASMQDPRFPQGREGTLVYKILELCKERTDVAEFQQTLKSYNQITALSNWEAAILIKIKRTFFPEGDAALEDELAGDVDEQNDDTGGGDDDLL